MRPSRFTFSELRTDAWVREQTEAFLAHAKAEKLPVTMVFHERDTKFTAALDGDLARQGIEVRKTAYCSPNTNAFVERFFQTIHRRTALQPPRG